MMGPMLEEFPATKNINKMKERIRKQGQNFAKEDKDRFIEIIKLGESVWQKTIQSQKAKTIEPRFFVQNLYTVYEELLVKYIHLNAKMYFYP
jgi:hypothetical protein